MRFFCAFALWGAITCGLPVHAPPVCANGRGVESVCAAVSNFIKAARKRKKKVLTGIVGWRRMVPEVCRRRVGFLILMRRRDDTGGGELFVRAKPRAGGSFKTSTDKMK